MIENGEIDSLQAILCNAGGRGFGPVLHSPEGYAATFAGNYLGHFLLVHLLVDSLANDGRIIFTASGTHDPDTSDGRAAIRGTLRRRRPAKLEKMGLAAQRARRFGIERAHGTAQPAYPCCMR